jgi:hypothetical protein
MDAETFGAEVDLARLQKELKRGPDGYRSFKGAGDV